MEGMAFTAVFYELTLVAMQPRMAIIWQFVSFSKELGRNIPESTVRGIKEAYLSATFLA